MIKESRESIVLGFEFRLYAEILCLLSYRTEKMKLEVCDGISVG